MMEVLIVVVSGIGGAWLMTFFLRGINQLLSHGVRVPLILSQVVHHYFNGAPFYSLRYKNAYGHAIHLLAGVFFAYCYHLLWSRGIGGFNVRDICLFGVVNGLVGVIGWWLFLKVTFEPEQVREKLFFPTVLIAHIPFAFGVAVIYFGLISLLT